MEKVSFQPLKVRRLSEVIEVSIKDMILTGELKVGSRLPTEPEIGRQFGVSIVTVREALRGLEAFGVIKKKRGKDGGVFVTEPESTIVKDAMHHFFSCKKFSANDLGQVRTILEPATASIAALKITGEELQGLENNIRYCENRITKKSHSFSAKDFFDIEERNVEFHRLTAEATHNPFLALTVDYIMDFLISLKKSTLSPDIGFSRRAVDDHHILLDDFRRRDPEAAQRDMLSHLALTDGYMIIKERKIQNSTTKGVMDGHIG